MQLDLAPVSGASTARTGGAPCYPRASRDLGSVRAPVLVLSAPPGQSQATPPQASTGTGARLPREFLLMAALLHKCPPALPPGPLPPPSAEEKNAKSAPHTALQHLGRFGPALAHLRDPLLGRRDSPGFFYQPVLLTNQKAVPLDLPGDRAQLTASLNMPLGYGGCWNPQGREGDWAHSRMPALALPSETHLHLGVLTGHCKASLTKRSKVTGVPLTPGVLASDLR